MKFLGAKTLMRKLLDHIEEKDLPGTTAHARLLLAKFRFKEGRIKESKKNSRVGLGHL